MAIDLQGRVCLITGAGQGIGRGVAEGFARRDATVVATDLAAPACAGAAMALPWDVAREPQAADVVRQVVERFGRIDVLVANAGVYPRQPLEAIDESAWRHVLGVNLDGAWFAMRAAAGAMKRQGYGKIIAVTSVEVLMGVAQHAHYDAAKAGIIGLVRSMAREVGGSGLRVNAVMPGAVLTPTERSIQPDPAVTAKWCDEKQCLPGRITPELVEPTFAFLASAESDAITGQVICVDQGLVHY